MNEVEKARRRNSFVEEVGRRVELYDPGYLLASAAMKDESIPEKTGLAQGEVKGTDHGIMRLATNSFYYYLESGSVNDSGHFQPIETVTIKKSEIATIQQAFNKPGQEIVYEIPEDPQEKEELLKFLPPEQVERREQYRKDIVVRVSIDPQGLYQLEIGDKYHYKAEEPRFPRKLTLSEASFVAAKGILEAFNPNQQPQ